jgi:hypothetical protein
VVDSAASARVAAYRQVHRQAAPAEPAGPGMAVLVQVMVTAEAAGVAFTANPLTGDRHEVVITAVRGQNRRDDPSCGGAARRPPIGLPARPMGESSGGTVSYPPVVRRARVGLLPSRSGRITMSAASTGRPPPPLRPRVPVRAALIGRSRVGPLPSSTAATFAVQPRPELRQSCSQQPVVIAAATGTEQGAEGAMRCRFVRDPPGGVPGPWQCARRVRLSAGRPGVRPIKAQAGATISLETVADRLPALLTRVPDAERPSLCL